MSTHPELDQRARDVIDGNKYLVLGTSDADGTPWVSPVYFTPDGYGTLFWVSSPETRHSCNLAVRPEVSAVVFDSSVPIGGAQAVYLTAHAARVDDAELAQCAAVYAGRYPELREYTAEELRDPAPFRLYRATVTEHWLLIPGSDPEHGTGVDSRLTVHP